MITQTDLNLAINYMVIEKLIMSMGIYDYIVEEYPILESIFKKANTGELQNTLNDKGFEKELEEKLEEFEYLFGLKREILDGRSQINLGISIDPFNATAWKMGKMTMDELNDYIESKINYYASLGNNPNKIYGQVYEAIPWVFEISGEQAINNMLKYKIGNIELAKEGYDIKQIVKKWAVNPLGLNPFGLYVHLIELGGINEKIAIKNNKGKLGAEELLERVFSQSFDIFSYKPAKTEKLYIIDVEETRKKCKKSKRKKFNTSANKSEKKYLKKVGERVRCNVYSTEDIVYRIVNDAQLGYKMSWKQNVYSLDTILFYIIRNLNYWLMGNKQDIPKLFKVLDKDDSKKKDQSLLPYPLVLDDKESDILRMIRVLSGEQDQEQGQEQAGENSKYNTRGYLFDFRYNELVEYSSIQQEINHYVKEEIPSLWSRHDRFVALLFRILSGTQDTLQSDFGKDTNGLEDTDDLYDIVFTSEEQARRYISVYDRIQWIERELSSIEKHEKYSKLSQELFNKGKGEGEGKWILEQYEQTLRSRHDKLVALLPSILDETEDIRQSDFEEDTDGLSDIKGLEDTVFASSEQKRSYIWLSNRIQWIEQEVSRLEKYVAYLKSSQELFNKDKGKWLLKQYEQIDRRGKRERYEKLSGPISDEHKEDLDKKKIAVTEKVFGIKEILTEEHEFITGSLTKMKDGIPWIEVKTPYYAYVPIRLPEGYGIEDSAEAEKNKSSKKKDKTGKKTGKKQRN